MASAIERYGDLLNLLKRDIGEMLKGVHLGRQRSVNASFEYKGEVVQGCFRGVLRYRDVKVVAEDLGKDVVRIKFPVKGIYFECIGFSYVEPWLKDLFKTLEEEDAFVKSEEEKIVRIVNKEVFAIDKGNIYHEDTEYIHLVTIDFRNCVIYKNFQGGRYEEELKYLSGWEIKDGRNMLDEKFYLSYLDDSVEYFPASSVNIKGEVK